MTRSSSQTCDHPHVYLRADHRRNERRTWAVIALTVIAMVVEVGAGTLFGSMALVADGWHMATHAGALLIAALTYGFARRHARDPRYSFGTGRLGDLGAFASAVILALVAVQIAAESLGRLVAPVAIRYDEALVVAVAGLLVNLVSARLLREDHHHHEHAHHHSHGEDSARHAHEAGRDNNLHSAYMHVLADALTSVFAIAALAIGALWGIGWLDPLIGLAGAGVIAVWAWGLLRASGAVLVGLQPDDHLSGAIRAALSDTGARIVDLHVWQVGPGHYAAIVALVAAAPLSVAACKGRLATLSGLSHVTVEIQGPVPESRTPASG